ncbi:fibronectin type III domain-containing protein [Janthinobacterium sp. PAMC25594]|uniref:fibronectin type III domain-containing protein n=1 Tax=Janthinobacterium sp. PAMC25594 TaxID=2861284 RepID=UPI001C639084|nr:fibronectin type III domain-containing protein [Janthinobacterium sp. PAMC25594]QYG08058.1 fibronectin type III domain-containing protein [Janthinobacterium sp. PAMC25594]
MPTITAGSTPQTISLSEGQVLNISGVVGTAGVAYRLDPVLGGTNSLQSWTIGAGALAQIGPYAGLQRFLVTCSAGRVDVSASNAVLNLSSGGAAGSIPFSAAVPLGGGSVVMEKKVVSGALTFVPSGAISGGVCVAEMLADGVNAPSFAAFEEHSSSSGWLNTAGFTNLVQFFCIGTRNYFSVSQPLVQGAPDLTPPTVASAIVAAALPGVLSVGFSEALASGFVPTASAFTVDGHAVTAVALRAAFVDLTVAPAFVSGEAARTAAYVQPGSGGLRDAAGNLVASFSGRAIANNAGMLVTVPAAPTAVAAVAGNGQATVTYTPGADGGSTITGYVATSTPGGFTGSGTSGPIAVLGLTNGVAYTFTVHAVNNIGNSAESAPSAAVTPAVPAAGYARFASLVNTTESGSADPYAYTGNGTAFGTAMGGIATKSRVVGTDGSCAVVLGAATDATHEAMLGLDNSATPVGYTSLDYAVFAPSTGTYRVVVGGVSTAATVAVSCAVGDIMRLSITGANLDAQVSKDGGMTWTTIYSWSGISASAVKYHIQAAKSAVLTASQIVGAA